MGFLINRLIKKYTGVRQDFRISNFLFNINHLGDLKMLFIGLIFFNDGTAPFPSLKIGRKGVGGHGLAIHMPGNDIPFLRVDEIAPHRS